MSTTPNTTKDEPAQSVVRVQSVLILALIFVLGVLATTFFTRLLEAETFKLSALDLINLTFSVALSGASIALAFVAIHLGKVSEQSILRRSAETLEIQQQVFTRTMDVLQRIGSSTGVTEKRIEDIIAGRIRGITHDIADIASGGKEAGHVPKKLLEEEIRRRIQRGLTEAGSGEDEEESSRRAQFKQAAASYQALQSSVLAKIANVDGVVTEKVGDGNTQGVGDALFDGVFRRGQVRFGVCVFQQTSAKTLRKGPFFANLASEILKVRVNKVVLVFDTEQAETIAAEVEESLSLFAEPVREGVITVAGSAAALPDKVGGIVTF